MRIFKRLISGKNGMGSVQLQATEAEDMWHLYNLISEDDLVTGSTVRNVTRESSTGSIDKKRIRISVKIRVERIEFDSEQCSLRLNGRNMEENEFIKMGQYHTLEIEVDFSFWLEKNCWDFIYLERLEEASDPSRKAEVAAIVMQEGLAHICLVTSAMTLTRARIEKKMPKKKQINQAHAKSMEKFFDEIYESIKRHINFDIVKVVLIGSPGFLKDDFVKFMLIKAERSEEAVILRNKSKFLKVHSSSGYKRAIEEILGDEQLRGQLEDVRAAAEVRALENFYSMLSTDQDRACYGYNEVQSADEQLAIADLLVTDKLFRAADMNLRKKYVQLVESVKEHGGQVFIFSSMHISGEQLDQYTGVAASLRFPLPEVAVICGGSDDSDDDDSEGDNNDSNSIDEIKTMTMSLGF